MKDSLIRISSVWALGVLIALLAVWGITAVTLSSRAEQVFDRDLGRVVFRPESVRQYRSEGWATTRYGRYGVPGIPDVTRMPGASVMIWGDSHVEAQEVCDPDKMAVVANAIWRERQAAKPLCFLSWGESGAAFANHFFDIPRYEKVLGDISRHYIVMSFTRRAFPNDTRSASSLFSEKGGVYEIVEKPLRPPSARTVVWRERLTRAGLHVMFELYAKASLASLSRLRFAVGPVRKTAPERDMPPFDAAYAEQGFAWILRELKRQTSRPVSVVYIPEVPKIVAGRIVVDSRELDPEEASRFEVFKKVCLAQGITLIDLTERFCEVARRGAAFPRGFANTRPSEGHLNALGHRLVAEAIVADIEATAP